MLVDDLPAQRGAEIDRLAAADHRIGERERLRLREAPEVDGHAERGHLVVGHLAAGVAEHELGELSGRQLLPVALALDELGGPDHVVATKIDVRACVTNGSGTSSGTGCVGTESESRYTTSFARSRTVTSDSWSNRSTLEKCRRSISSPFSRLKVSSIPPGYPFSRRSSLRCRTEFVTATSVPPGCRTRASSDRPR